MITALQASKHNVMTALKNARESLIGAGSAICWERQHYLEVAKIVEQIDALYEKLNPNQPVQP